MCECCRQRGKSEHNPGPSSTISMGRAKGLKRPSLLYRVRYSFTVYLLYLRRPSPSECCISMVRASLHEQTEGLGTRKYMIVSPKAWLTLLRKR